MGLLTGDNIVAGRLVSLAAFLLTGLGIAAVSRAMGTRVLPSILAALFFMVLGLFDYDHVGVENPTFLAHAFGIAGLWCALAGRRSAPKMLAAALFLSLAFLTKHNLFVVPLVLLAWLVACDRRAALWLGVCGTAIAIASCLAFSWLYGHSLWSEIDSPRLFIPADCWHALRGLLESAGLPLLASLAAAFVFRKESSVRFCLLYLFSALAAGTVLSGGAGTSGNLMFDALIALALLMAVTLDLFLRQGRAAWQSASYALCLVMPLLCLVTYQIATDALRPRYWADRNNAAVVTTAHDIAFIRAQNGPAICEYLALCYWAGKPAELDAFNMGQALLAHRRDGDDLKAAIASQRYALIATDLDNPELWRRDIADTIRAHYRVQYSDALGSYWVRR